MTPDQADEIVATIVATWPHPPITQLGVRVWTDILEPLDFNAGVAALSHLMGTANWRPTPKDLTDLITGSGWELAWNAVAKLQRSTGSYATGDQITALGSATVDAIHACGGWRHLCSIEGDSPRQLFRQHYRAVTERPNLELVVDDTPALPPGEPNPFAEPGDPACWRCQDRGVWENADGEFVQCDHDEGEGVA